MEDLKDRMGMISETAKTGIALRLVVLFLNDPTLDQESDWDAFVKSMIKTTRLTRKDLTEARKFLEDDDDTQENEVGEDGVQEDRGEDKGDSDREGHDPKGTESTGGIQEPV